jgi:hypothetical protein
MSKLIAVSNFDVQVVVFITMKTQNFSSNLMFSVNNLKLILR